MLDNYQIIRKDPLLAVLKLCICVVALFLISHYMPKAITHIEQARHVYDEPMVRVIANSNTKQDQLVKQKIVREIARIHYIDIENPRIIKQIEDILAKKYAHIPIEIKIGDNLFPPKWFGQTFYPQMRQKSLVIHIGQARGDNWFCSVFPTVCGKKDRDKIRFKWWEWIKEKWL